MIRLHPLAATLAAAVVLAGCSNDAPEAPEVVVTSTPSLVATPSIGATPNTGATPSSTVTRDLPAPEVSELGKDFSQDGASAFASYYIKVLNFSRNSGDIELLNSISDTTCLNCSYDVDDIEKMRKLGYSHDGLETQFRGTSYRSWDPSIGEAQMDVYVDRAPHRILDATGTEIASVPGITNSPFFLWLKWVDDHWVVWDVE